jgi:hypothetical protein
LFVASLGCFPSENTFTTNPWVRCGRMSDYGGRIDIDIVRLGLGSQLAAGIGPPLSSSASPNRRGFRPPTSKVESARTLPAAPGRLTTTNAMFGTHFFTSLLALRYSARIWKKVKNRTVENSGEYWGFYVVLVPEIGLQRHFWPADARIRTAVNMFSITWRVASVT